jgi:hypothetical protein
MCLAMTSRSAQRGQADYVVAHSFCRLVVDQAVCSSNRLSTGQQQALLAASRECYWQGCM